MKTLAWGEEPTQFFFALSPERVLDAVESSGLRCTGRCLAMNSLENRVYEVELEADEEVNKLNRYKYQRIVKFYRPGRWTEQQIKEEHEFLFDLQANEVPVIAPEFFSDGQSLKKMDEIEIFYTLFPKRGGRAPEELTNEQLEVVGRLLARLHTVGAAKKAKNRILLHPDTYGLKSLTFLLQQKLIPMEFERTFANTVEQICKITTPWFNAAEVQRIHGDLHLQNMLWSSDGLMLLDFDDMVQGPCVQDIWLIVQGRDAMVEQQREILLQAYESMRPFDRGSLRLIEPLRALRLIHFSAWIGKRWQDPAFPHAFPQYGSNKYWNELTCDLEDQLRIIKQL